MGEFDDLLAEINAPSAQQSTVNQSLARGLMPQFGLAAPMTRAVPETYQVMTPIEGPIMTPASFTALPAEQQSALTLESMMRQRAQRDLIKAEQERLNRSDARTAYGLNLADSMAFGLGTEGAALGEALLTDKSYGDLIREYGTAKERLYETNPYASIAGGITGALLPSLITGGASLAGRVTPKAAAVAAGRLAPTLAEQAVLGTTGSELAAAAQAAGRTVPQVTKGQALAQLMEVGALQGALGGAAGMEPTTGMSTQEALLRRGVAGAAGGLFGAATPAVLAGAAGVVKAPKTLREAMNKLFNPITENEADAAVGNLARAAGVTEEGLQGAIQEAAQSPNPLSKELSTVELLQNPELAKVQRVVETGGGAGKQSFWEANKSQLDKINQLVRDTVDNIDPSNPDEAIRIQRGAQEAINARYTDLKNQGNAMYDALPDVNYKRSDVEDALAKKLEERYGPGRGRINSAIQYAFDFLTNLRYKEGGKLSREVISKARSPKTSITGRELVNMRSGLLDASRDLAESDPSQAALAGDLADVVHDYIMTDANFGSKFKPANDHWSSLIDTFQKGKLPTSQVTDPQIVSPETFNQKVTKDIASWQKFQEQTGMDPKMVKEQLAIKFDEFANAGADAENIGARIKAKLKWIKENGSILTSGSPIDNEVNATLAKAKQTLTFIDDFLKTKKNVDELVAPGFSADNLGDLGLDELAQIALNANPKAGSAAASANKAGIRQFMRDKLRQTLGLAAATSAGSYLYGARAGKILAGAAAAGSMSAALYKNQLAKEQSGLLLNKALVKALQDPAAMQRALSASSAQAAAVQSKATSGAAKTLADTAIGKTIMQVGRGLESAATTKAQATNPANKPPAANTSEFADLISEIESKKATPTPTKEPSFAERAMNVLVPSAQAEELTAKQKSTLNKIYAMPPAKQKALIAKHYNVNDVKAAAKKYDKLTRAQIAVESNFNHASVSRVGAIGAMQIMPATAKAHGYNPFSLEGNIRAGKAYRTKLVNQFNDTKLGLMAYNWGPGNVRKALNWLESRRKSPTFENVIKYADMMPFKVPEEARQYVRKVAKAYKSEG